MTDAKTAKPAADKVRVRVLKKGDGKVHKGDRTKYAKGEEFDAPLDVATNLENAGLVDVL